MKGILPTGRIRGNLYLAIGLFLGSAVIALWLPEYQVQNTVSGLAQVLSPLKGMSPILLALLIFLNNAFKAFIIIVSGWLMGVGPGFFLVFNGLILGLALRDATGMFGAVRAALGILPHGVIELPAIMLAAALGFQVAGQIFQKLRGRPAHVRAELRQGLVTFFSLIVPALFLAALVEAFITPLLVGVPHSAR